MLVSTALVCVGAVLIGQLTLRLFGVPAWSWSSPAVGMAVMLLVSTPVLHVPGGPVTTALVLLALLVAGAVLAAREPAHRLPVTGLLAGIPVLLLALVPFLSSWRAGTLGVGFNNDMGAHLALADGFQFGSIDGLSGADDYPIGPHTLAAALAEGLGARVDFTFAGLSVAIPVLLGWTALGALRGTGLLRRAPLALVVGISFLVASYYAQGSFKELLQALFSLAVVLHLGRPLTASLWRWVPLGLLLAGSVSVYSWPGLVWPVGVIGAWLVVTLVIDVRERGSVRHAWTVARADVAPVLAASAVVVVALVPQIPRLARFLDTGAGRFDAQGLGNLVARLPVWLAFGTWDQPDYRLPAIDPFATGMWTAFVLGLALVGAVWCIRGRQWIVPLGTLIFLLIWAYTDRTEAPYVAAKALAILAPMLLLLAALPVMDADPPGLPSPRWWRILAPLLAVVLVAKVGVTSWHGLRIASVGPTAHLDELRELRPGLEGRKVLFLGNDDSVVFELAGVDVSTVVLGVQTQPTRPEKPWAYGLPLDFDSLPTERYNDYDWVVTPRDAAGSAPPEGLRLVRRTRTFDLYRRVGTVPRRDVLAEGAGSGALLRCATRAGRALLRRGGVAFVREPPVVVPVPAVAPGATATVTLPLSRGTWDLQLPYISPRPLAVRAAGRRFELPASADRPGVRLPAGAISVTRSGPVAVRVTATQNWLTPRAAVANPTEVIATRRGTGRLVPVREACGRYVDWYRTGAAS